MSKNPRGRRQRDYNGSLNEEEGSGSREAQDGDRRIAIGQLRMEEFDPTSTSWLVYWRRLSNMFALYDVPANKRVLALLHCIGQQAYQKVSDLCAPDPPEDRALDELVSLLSNFYHPEPNKISERVKFHTMYQKSEESAREYYSRLKGGSNFCKFPEIWLNEAICTQFVLGLKSDELRVQLMSVKDLDMARALDMASAFEVGQKGIHLTKNIRASGHDNVNEGLPVEGNVDRVYKARPNEKENTKRKKCFRCGKANHTHNRCFFRNAKCLKCKKMGHIAKVCSNDQFVQDIDGEQQSAAGSETEEHVWQLRDDHRKKLLVKVQLGTGDEMFQIDTGASVSLMGKHNFFKLFPDVKLKRADVRLKTYTDEVVKVLGVASVKIRVNDQSKVVDLYVVDGDHRSMFGLEWLRLFKLDWNRIFHEKSSINNYINQVTCHKDSKDKLRHLLQNYKDIFQDELGKIKGMQARIHLKENSKPIFKRARPVPFTLLPKVTFELDRLEKQEIISKINFSEYATPVVPIVKKDGSIRLCGDYKVTINPQLKVDEHPIPNIEYLLTKLGNSKWFTKLDVMQAYTHVEVHPDDRKYLTINTHKGLYTYNRLPFGISSAPAIWQRTIEQVLSGIDNIAIFFDDICLASETEEEHCNLLNLVLERFAKFDIHVNKIKCEFFKESVEYCGYKISKMGIEKCKSKIEAILNVREPRNPKEVKSFLGMINFYGRFIKNLSTIAYPLNLLLRKGNKFNFNNDCKKSFQELKKVIASEKVLVPYDPKKKLLLATDASPFGIGAVLSHIMEDGSERPISFASRTLTQCECNYSQIDKEALSIIYGVKKFYCYLYGRKFTLITDHKPLVSIFHPSKEIPKLSAARMQHYAIYLQTFNYDIVYRKTSEHGNADLLSRLPLPGTNKNEPSSADIFQIDQISMLPINSKKIAEELEKEPDKKALMDALKYGAPIHKRDMFGHKLEEFSIQNNCIMWGHRVYIPETLRARILKELHLSHQGIVKTKALARSVVWWPRIDHDIEAMVNECRICQQFRNDPPKENTHPWDYPSAPMERIHIDYAGPLKGYYYLIVVDAFSKWTEVFPVKAITSASTINCLNRFFSSFGFPKVIVSDNGPQFKSEEFWGFCKANGIRQSFSAPFHPATNGLAERNIQTFKRSLHMALLMEKSVATGVSQFLMAYRRTPHCSTGESPAQLFIGREIRTRLDIVKGVNDGNKTNNEIERTKGKWGRKDSQKKLREVSVGDKVAVRFYGRVEDKWKVGKVQQKFGKLHYLVKVGDIVHRRHIDQLRKIAECNDSKEEDLSKEEKNGRDDRKNPGAGHDYTRRGLATRSGRRTCPPQRYSPT